MAPESQCRRATIGVGCRVVKKHDGAFTCQLTTKSAVSGKVVGASWIVASLLSCHFGTSDQRNSNSDESQQCDEMRALDRKADEVSAYRRLAMENAGKPLAGSWNLRSELPAEDPRPLRRRQQSR